MPTPDQDRGTNSKKKKADTSGITAGVSTGIPAGVEVKPKRVKAATKLTTRLEVKGTTKIPVTGALKNSAKRTFSGNAKEKTPALKGSRSKAGYATSKPAADSRSRKPVSASARQAAAVRAIPKTGLGEIERLRIWRPASRSAGSIASEVEALTNMLQRNEVAAGGLARAWATLAPRDLQAVTRVERLHAGVLTVIASDASAKYEVEMWLQESGLSSLRGLSARTLRRVKVVIA